MKLGMAMLLALTVSIVVFLILFVFLPAFTDFDIIRYTLGNGNTGEPKPPPAAGPSPLVSVARPLSYEQQHYAPSEIGCAIAQSITLDFSNYGTKGARSCFGDLCPVGEGIFGLGSDWKFSEIDDKKMDIYGCAACEPNLDEVCLTRSLARQTVGDAGLCSNTIYTFGSKEYLRFGNRKCVGFNPGKSTGDCPDWNGCCPELCPAADDLGTWRADSKSGNDVMDDSFRKESGQQLVQDGREYGWSVFWSRSSKGYVVEFPRVPTNTEKGTQKIDDIVAGISDVFKGAPRDNMAGAWRPELRAVYDWNFTAGDGMGMAGFASYIATMIRRDYVDYTMTLENCYDIDSCTNVVISPGISKVEIVDASDGSVKHTHYWPRLFEGGLVENPSLDYNVFRIRTNIPGDSGIIAGHSYRMILNHYASASKREAMDPSKSPDCFSCPWGTHPFWCEGQGGADVAYLRCSCGAYVGQACGVDPQRHAEGLDWCAKDCAAGDLFEKYYYWRYMDYSLVLMDMGAIL